MSNKIHDFLQEHKIGKLSLTAILIVIFISNIYQYGPSIENIGGICVTILLILYITYPKWKLW
jgi:hypothetical protein